MNEERNRRDQNIAAWLAFLRTHSRVTSKLEEELEAAESLPMTWFDVLVQLREAPEKRLRIQELGSKLAMSVSGLSRRISRMEQEGLVERKPCPEDRRGVVVELTREGARRHRRAVPVHLRGVDRYFLDHVTDEESEVLETVFNRILASLETPAD